MLRLLCLAGLLFAMFVAAGCRGSGEGARPDPSFIPGATPKVRIQSVTFAPEDALVVGEVATMTVEWVGDTAAVVYFDSGDGCLLANGIATESPYTTEFRLGEAGTYHWVVVLFAVGGGNSRLQGEYTVRTTR